MLEFDFVTDCFLLDGVRIGRGTREADVQGHLAGRLYDVVGHPAYRNFDGKSDRLNIVLAFRDGLLESGYFFVALPQPGSWDRLEQNEAWRREQHEAIMRSLFGPTHYESAGLIVDLIREPRNGTEQLRFIVP